MAATDLVPVTVTAGAVVYGGHHAFREGDTLHLPAAHAAELHGHLAAATARHETTQAASAEAEPGFAPSAPPATPDATVAAPGAPGGPLVSGASAHD